MTAKIFSEPDGSIEFRELLELAERHGLGEFCQVLMYGDCFTKKGRINKCAVCRELGLKPKEFEICYKRLRALFAPVDDDTARPRPNRKPKPRRELKAKWRMRVLMAKRFPNVGLKLPGTILETSSKPYVTDWVRKGWAEVIQMGDEHCWMNPTDITQR
jgi:hypothetical protein